IENIAGSHEFAPRLQDIFQPAALLPVETAEDGKDRADAYVDVDIGGAVERIVDENVTTLPIALGKIERLFVVFGGHDADPAGVVAQADQGLVGVDVQLLLLFALDVDLPGPPQNVEKAGAVGLVG